MSLGNFSLNDVFKLFPSLNVFLSVFTSSTLLINSYSLTQNKIYNFIISLIISLLASLFHNYCANKQEDKELFKLAESKMDEYLKEYETLISRGEFGIVLNSINTRQKKYENKRYKLIATMNRRRKYIDLIIENNKGEILKKETLNYKKMK